MSPSVRAPGPKGESTEASAGTHARIHSVVRRIPRGRVATYGQVAALAGLGRHARLVGYALSALDEGSTVPWQRVVNARGEVSPRSDPFYERLQRRLLEEEGVAFDPGGRIPLARFRWRARAAAVAGRLPSSPASET